MYVISNLRTIQPFFEIPLTAQPLVQFFEALIPKINKQKVNLLEKNFLLENLPASCEVPTYLHTFSFKYTITK